MPTPRAGVLELMELDRALAAHRAEPFEIVSREFHTAGGISGGAVFALEPPPSA